MEASACPKWSGSWGSSVFLPTKNLSWGYDLFTINDFYPCGRCNHVFNDYRLFPQIIIRILSEWKKCAFVPVSRFSPLTTGRTILLIYWSLCLIKNTIETLQALCVQHVFFSPCSPFTSTPLLSFQHTDKKTTKVSPSCLGGRVVLVVEMNTALI